MDLLPLIWTIWPEVERHDNINAIRVARVTGTLIVDAISPSLIKHVQPEGKLV